MAFGSFNGSSGGRAAAPMAEINVIPLVDIMLVLLVIFIVTAPLLTHTVKIDLPRTDAAVTAAESTTVQFALDGAGQMYWDGAPIEDAQLPEHLREAAARQPKPELQLQVDRQARYERLAQVISAAGAAGLDRIAFVTEPNRPAPSPQ